MTQQPAERIHALPILLLVFGALSVGIGLWFIVAEPRRAVGAVLLLLTGAVLFTAAGITLRAAARRDRALTGREPHEN